MIRNDSYAGVGVTEKTLAEYKKVVAELTSHEDWLVGLTRRYPVCCDIPTIKLYTCFSSRDDIQRLRNKLQATIDEYEKADSNLRDKWWFRLLSRLR